MATTNNFGMGPEGYEAPMFAPTYHEAPGFYQVAIPPKMTTEVRPVDEDARPRPRGRKIAAMSAVSLEGVELAPGGRHSMYDVESAAAEARYAGGTVSSRTVGWENNPFGQ